MSTPTLAELLTSRTADEWTAIALTRLQGRGFPTTDWGSTAPERAMLETDTVCLADQDEQIPLIVQLVLVYYATGDALRFLAYHFYGIVFFPATPTIGDIKLTCNALGGPYTIVASQLIATDGAGHLYRNLTGGTLNTGGTLTPSWTAESPGVAGNVASNTISTLLTPLPGVTINNAPAAYSVVTHVGSGTGTLTLTGTPTGSHAVVVRIDGTGASGVATWSTSLDGGAFSSHGAAASITNLGGFGIDIALTNGASEPSFVLNDTLSFATPGTWITTQGTDIESDTSLKTRVLARWPSLADVPTTDVYTAWALQSIPGQVTRIKVVTNPSVAATVDIYCAGPSAPITSAQVNEVQAYIDVRAPLTDLPVVHAATTTAVTITGAASYPVGRVGGHADLDAAIVAYGNGVVEGGTIEIAQIIALALKLNESGTPTGATNITGVQLNAVSADFVLGSTAVASITNSIAWTPV